MKQIGKNTNGEPKVGKNIKKLRTRSGESQRELGAFLNLQPTTIANYESGDREPSLQVLREIALHYRKTVDELLGGDFSDMISLKFAFGNREKMREAFEEILPITCSEEALKNVNFKKGYDLNLRILESLKCGQTLSWSMFDDCLLFYGQSYYESETVESAANALWVFFCLWTPLFDDQAVKIGEALHNQSGRNPMFPKDFYLKKSRNIDSEFKNKRQQFFDDYGKAVTGLLRILKSSPNWSDLADYYIALRYLLCMVDNGLSDDMNREIGTQILMSSLSMENQYAVAFEDMCLNLIS